MTNLNIIVTAKVATVILDGHPYPISREHDRFEDVIEAYNSGDTKALKRIIDALNHVEDWGQEHTQGDVTLKGRKVYYKGEEMENVVTERIVEWVSLGLEPAPMINFLERLLKNPSYQSRQELLLFLEHSNLPIQKDGRFLAYKVVRNNFLDKHSGTFDNSVGKTVEMPRGEVDDKRTNTCSSGLHFCSKDYVPHFSWGEDRLVLLAIDPADVVSIPNDYNNAKGRCCKYEVIQEVKQPQSFKSPLYENRGTYFIRATDGYYNYIVSIEYDGFVAEGDVPSEDVETYDDYLAAQQAFESITREHLAEEKDCAEYTVTLVNDKNGEVLITKTV